MFSFRLPGFFLVLFSFFSQRDQSPLCLERRPQNEHDHGLASLVRTGVWIEMEVFGLE